MRPDEKFKEFFFHPSFSSLFYLRRERYRAVIFPLLFFFFIIFLDKNSRQIVRKRIFFFPLIFLYIYMYYSFSFLFVSHSTRARDTTLSYFFFFLHVSFLYSPFFLRFVRSPQYTQARFLLFPLLFFYIYFYVSPRGERYNRDNFKK